MTGRIADGSGRGGTDPGPGAAGECALMERVAAQHMDAFEALYRIYQPRLLRFIHGIVHRPALVEEVFDDTMLVVWRKAGSYDRSAKVSSWIFAIAYRQALKALRRVDDAMEFHSEAAADGPGAGPETAWHQQQLQRRLQQALDGLSAEHRAVIELTYYLGYSCAEIARILECPVDTVKTRMFYARRRLKGLLGLSWEEAV